jgi:ATP-dependent DNA helicase DinG
MTTRSLVKRIAKEIPELIKKNRGRTLVLFSSYDDLRNVAERVSDDILNATYPLLIQQPGIPTVNLCDEFRTVKESVLFGVDTFWYGVDFRGDTLTQVIITRIPYPSPKDPIQMSRKAMMSPDRYWRRYSYEKDIKLKQGIGRLIRSQTDRGRCSSSIHALNVLQGVEKLRLRPPFSVAGLSPMLTYA